MDEVRNDAHIASTGGRLY